MILATVGTQLPFPRLLEVLDRLAVSHSLRIVAQTCGNLPHARAIEQHEFLAPADFEDLAGQAQVIVGHAGIGTIFAAARARKPLVLYPRRVALGEHRNDHQMATAASVETRPGIHIAWDDADLERLLMSHNLEPMVPGESPTRPALIAAVAAFVAGERD